jgi:hypothetical protein
MRRLMTITAVHGGLAGSERWEATGRFDAEGEAKLRRVPRIVPPGTYAEFDDDQVPRLLSLGAIREPTEHELMLWKMANGEIVAQDAEDQIG